MNKKQTFWRALALATALLTMPATVWADSAFGGGSGTPADPYRIENPQHLRQLAADVNNGNSYENKYFKMTQSFSCWIEPFTPIGGKYYTTGSGSNSSTGTQKFCGTFDGNGYTINDLNIRPMGDFYGIGLFGELGYGAVVKNLTIGSSNITSTIMGWGNSGAIAGCVNNNAGIYDCQVKSGVIVSVDPDHLAQIVTSSAGFGGIAGENMGIISNCTSKATVTNADINGVNTLGGIVGYNGGKVWSCISLATVIGSNQVGGIAGNKSNQCEFSSNYYRSERTIGGVNGQNIDGATWMGKLNYTEWVAGSANSSVVYSDNGTNYYKPGTTMWMSLNLLDPAGYVIHNNDNAQFIANGVPMTDDMMGGVEYKVFYMPAEDVTISATGIDYQRDIAYSQWFKINIPTQEYTGEALTPAVTITDIKDGANTVLIEGTHYTITLPQNPMVEVGEYTLTITGIGDFTNSTTATFTIDPIGGSSEWYGSGTQTDPYRICSVNAMSRVAERITEMDYTNVYFVLDADLDYTGKEYKIIGSGSNQFQGKFDGKGHTLSNVTIVSGSNYTGLFGQIGENGVVKNLILGSGSQVPGTQYTAAICGMNRGRIEGCINYAEISGYRNSGGIAAMNYNVVLNCCNYGNVTADNKSAGGIVAYTGGNVENCVNEGRVSSGGNNVGGIVGYHYQGSVYSSLNLGIITGSSDVGGIIGYNNGINYSHLNNYYAPNTANGGIRGQDAEGVAMKGYTITGDYNVVVDLVEEATVGIAYNNKVYAGKNQQVNLYIDLMDDTECEFVASAGSLNDNEDGTWTLIMPAENVIISNPSQSMQGDVNGDQKVNVLDVTTLINMILKVIPTTDAANVNGDEDVNVLDVTALINIILRAN